MSAAEIFTTAGWLEGAPTLLTRLSRVGPVRRVVPVRLARRVGWTRGAPATASTLAQQSTDRGRSVDDGTILGRSGPAARRAACGTGPAVTYCATAPRPADPVGFYTVR